MALPLSNEPSYNSLHQILKEMSKFSSLREYNFTGQAGEQAVSELDAAPSPREIKRATNTDVLAILDVFSPTILDAPHYITFL